MCLIIVHKNNKSPTGGNGDLLRFAVSSEPIGDFILDELSRNLCLVDTSAVIAVPQGWSFKTRAELKMIPYSENLPICQEHLGKTGKKQWFTVSNGRFVTKIDNELLYKVLAGIRADVVTVNVEPELTGKGEKTRLTAQGKVAGLRRLYMDSAEPASVPDDWPHHILVKTNLLSRLAPDSTLPQSFSALLKRCRSNALTLRAIIIGGAVLDLETEDGLLSFCQAMLSKIRTSGYETQNSNVISPSSRLVGKVLLGKNIRIGPKAIVVGPAIIGSNVRISSSAVVNSSIIGPGVHVPVNQIVHSRVVKGPHYNWKRLTQYKGNDSKHVCSPRLFLNHLKSADETFRIWPRFSYAGSFKRIADIVAAVTVLILFAPFLPIIALVVKLTSRGPVFFRDPRQGLHGKVFKCLKFRTMIEGAEKIQDKLRGVSQVDGPQFKIPDDPRLSAVGKFLRDTYIDEIPQFFNVLLGQMSVVGPRPSPESENTMCPSWRDARLSARPGITGLWQVCGTREPMKDFQEWIHYDIKYVRELSLKTDLWICWQTIKKMVGNFVRQF